MRLKAHNAKPRRTLHAINRMQTNTHTYMHMHMYMYDMCGMNAFGIAGLFAFFAFLYFALARIKTLSTNLGLSFVLPIRFLFYLLSRFYRRSITYFRALQVKSHTPIFSYTHTYTHKQKKRPNNRDFCLFE